MFSNGYQDMDIGKSLYPQVLAVERGLFRNGGAGEQVWGRFEQNKTSGAYFWSGSHRKYRHLEMFGGEMMMLSVLKISGAQNVQVVIQGELVWDIFVKWLVIDLNVIFPRDFFISLYFLRSELTVLAISQF